MHQWGLRRAWSVVLLVTMLAGLLPQAALAIALPGATPVANPDAYTASSDAPIVPLVATAPGVLANDGGGVLSAALVSAPSHATAFTLHADGSFTYTPMANYTGPDSFTYTASNGHATSVAATVTITVGHGLAAPAITSANGTTFTIGVPGTFTVTTTGFPLPMIAETGPLPGGVSLTDNHDGTATLAGTPGMTSGGVFAITITAHNGSGADATQAFTLTVNGNVAFTSAAQTTFTVGQAPSTAFTITTSGIPAVTSITESGPLPTGVTFVDNHDGTAKLTGAPNAGTGGAYPLTLTAHNGAGPDATQAFTLTVDEAPTITSANHVTFVVGTAGTFAVVATGFPAPTFSEIGTLPANVTLAANGTLAGTPAVGTGGVYPITITAHNAAAPDAIQTFTLTVDAAPTVASTTPANGATNVPLNSTVTVTFDKQVNVTGTAFTLECPSGTPVAFTVTPASPATTFVLHPTANLPGGVACTLTVVAAQVTDTAAGTPMSANYVATFTADTAPLVTSTTPANAATNVALNSTVTVNFNEAVNVTGTAFKLECPAGTPVAFTVTPASPAASFVLHPTANLPGGVTCTVTVVASQVTDVSAGTPMGANFVATFSVDTPPVVTSTTPANGATGVLPNASVTITFNEAVNVTGTAFKLECPAGTPVPFTVTPASPAASFVLQPTANLPGGVTCTVTVVASQVTDTTAGTALAADVVATFTVDTPPTVTSTTPANGATNVIVGTTITVNFSESVNATGPSFTLACPIGTPVAFTLSPASPASSFVLTPSAALPGAVTCTLTVVAAQITDVDAGQHPTADTVVSFATDAPPTVTSTVPANNATAVLPSATVTVNFSEPVNVTGTAFKLECPAGTPVAFTVTPASPASSFVLHPTAALPAGAICTVTAVAAQITDVDAGQHLMADSVTTFTVNTPPTVTSITPANGATNVAPAATVTVTFSEPVNVTGSAFTLECPTGTPVAFTVTPASPATSFVLHPTAKLPGGVICTATAVAAQITDVDAGQAMAANVAASFTIDAPPTVTTIVPANGATNVALNSAVTVTFSEPVNVTGTAFTLECPSGTPVAFGVSPASPATSFVLTPSANLPGGAVCTTTVVASQVTDVDFGQNMAANFTASFTVDTPPTVTTTTPANGATGVATTATVTVNFSKSVNVTASAFTLECPAGTPVAFTVTPASPAISFVLTPSANLPAGVVCTASVVAAQVTDTVGTAMAANYTFTFNVPPIATNDTYPHNVIGNVSVNSSLIPYSATSNDVSVTPFTITAFDTTSAHGGTVTMTTSGAGIGQLTYNPAAGYTGNDSFTYTITSAGGSATGTVSFTVSGIIWFIDNNAAAGDGRLSSPFNSLAAFQAINDGVGTHPAANANIFLYESATNYTGPVTLLNGQKLIGQDATATLAAITGLTPGASSASLPAMNSGNGTIVRVTSGGNTVTLGSGNTVQGLTLGNSTGTALTGASVGALKLRDLTINTTGAAVSLASGSLDAILASVTAGGGTHGLALTSTTGSFEVTGDGASDPANTTHGRTTAKNGGGTLTLGSGGTVSGATSAGVLLNNASNVTLRNVTIQNNGTGINTGGDGITASGGTSGLTLDNVKITGHAGNYGLHGTTVSNVALQHTEISANATTAGVETPHVWNVRFDDLTGASSSIQNSLFFNSRENIMGLEEGSISGTATATLTVANSEFRDTATTAPGNDGLSVNLHNSANVTLSVSNSTFLRNRSGAVQYTGNDSSGGGSVSVTNSTFDQNAIDVNIAHQGVGKTVGFTIQGNTMRQTVGGQGNSINIFLAGLSNATSVLQGKILSNVIGNNAVPDSGSSQGQGIDLFASGAGTITATVDGNTVRQIHQDSAFQAISSNHTGQLNLTVTNNDFRVSTTSGLGLFGIDLTVGGSGGAGDTGTFCAHLFSNIAAVADPTLWGINAQALASGATLNLQGYSGAANNIPQINAYLNTTTTTVSPPAQAFISGGTIKAAPSPCPTPP